jgi:multicomponent Na+:H+ antiporter subunit B
MRARLVLFGAGALGLVALLVVGFAGLPEFGTQSHPYGDRAVAVAHEQQTANAVASVTFDQRGYDTLGEEFILFAAVLGVAILLRAQRDEEEREPSESAYGRSAPRTSDAVRALALALVGPTVVTGWYIVAHGHLTPGGGFQGGVVLATALLMIYVAGEYKTMQRVAPMRLVALSEAAGAGAYVVIGIGGMLAGAAFLQNILPLGEPGNLNSAGMVPLINISVGLEVAAGFVLILTEFLEQTLLVRLKEHK